MAVSANGDRVFVGTEVDRNSPRNGSAYAFQLTVGGAITRLSSQVTALALPRGIEVGMLKELEGARDKLEDDNLDNDEAAIGKLLEFISKVDDQEDAGRILDDAADSLVADATDIIFRINEDLEQPLLDDELLALLAGS